MDLVELKKRGGRMTGVKIKPVSRLCQEMLDRVIM
jgi:hypothetical protein